MLRTLNRTRDLSLMQRLTGIAVFALLTTLAARITIPVEPVPFTLQTLAVFLAGMVLGARDGAWSQVLYVMLIAVGLPLDARGVGSAVFAGPTWGYLVAFIPCAFVAGWLVERSGERVWQRVAAGLVGLVIVYLVGTTVLAYMTHRTLPEALTAGVVPFIAGDIAKAIIAGVLTEGLRTTLLRMLNPVQ